MRFNSLSYLLVCLGMGSACTMSTLDPYAEVVVAGTAFDSDRQVVSGLTVVMTKEPDLGEVLGSILVTPITLLSCLGDSAPVICEGASTAITDSSGQFQFFMKGSDTQGSLGQARYFNLVSQLKAGISQVHGATMHHRFIVNEAEYDLPDMMFWDPAITQDIVADTLSIQVERGVPSQSNVRVQFMAGDSEFISRGVSIWDSSEEEAVSIDVRILEDADAIIVASRTTNVGGVETTQQSGGYWFEGSTRVPPSRGSRCFIDTLSGEKEEMSPCPLTDGEFGNASVFDPNSSCPENEPMCEGAPVTVSVDLGESIALGMVVVRSGKSQRIQLEVSNSGDSWTPLGLPNSGDFVVTLPDVQVARWIRVVNAEFSEYPFVLTELSVWQRPTL